MTAQAEERRPARQSPAGQGAFDKKYGPLPGWGWALLAGGAALAYFLYRKYQAAQAAAQAQPTTVTGAVDYGPSIATIQSEIQQLQGQASKPGSKGPGCPGDMYWDADANGGKGKCVPEPGPKAKPKPKRKAPPKRKPPEPAGDQ